MGGPAPPRGILDLIVDAGLRAPNHGRLVPWRVIEIAAEAKPALADLFEAEKLRRDPLATPEDLERAREHAVNTPVSMAFIASPKAGTVVPLHEQWLAAGAALSNMLAVAHFLGLGASILSGDRCQDDMVRGALGVQPHETLAGFISIGQIVKAPKPAEPVG